MPLIIPIGIIWLSFGWYLTHRKKNESQHK